MLLKLLFENIIDDMIKKIKLIEGNRMKKRLKARGSAELWMTNSLAALESAGFDEIMADRSRGVITAAAEGEPIEMHIAAAGDRTEILMIGSERGMAVYKKAVARVFSGQPVTKQFSAAGLSELDQVMAEGQGDSDSQVPATDTGDNVSMEQDSPDLFAWDETAPDGSAQPRCDALVVPAAPPKEVVVGDKARVTAEKLKPVSGAGDQSKRSHNWIYPLIVLVVIAAAAFAAWQIGLLDGVLEQKKAAAPKKKKVTQTETTYTKVTAGDLLKQWLNDATAAEKQYEGKPLEITGVIKSIDPYGSNFKVTASDFQYGADITCWLTKQEDRDAITKSQVGKTITVKGTVDDVGSGFGYDMKTVDSFTIGQ